MRCSVFVKLKTEEKFMLGRVVRMAQQYQGTVWGRGSMEGLETLDIAIPSEAQADALVEALQEIQVEAVVEFKGDNRVTEVNYS